MKLLFRLALFLSLAFVVLCSIFYLYLLRGLPEVGEIKGMYPLVVYENDQAKIIFDRKPGRNWVKYEDVSELARWAILLSEDSKFFQHPGFDWEAIKEAIQDDIEAGRFKRGGSTITQQVVKNVFLTRKKKIKRKIKELILSIEMEKTFTKKQIFEIYLNIAEWGPRVHGIKRASQYYFRKPPRSLTAKEGAFLAMLLPSPIKNSTSFRKGELTEFARKRILSTLKKLVVTDRLTFEQAQKEFKTPMWFEDDPLSGELENNHELSEDDVTNHHTPSKDVTKDMIH